MKITILVFLSFVVLNAQSQELQPYPDAHVTEAQWQEQFDAVKTKQGENERDFPAEHLIVFDDPKTSISWAFTTPGHPAHPAWIARQSGKDSNGIYINQVGYFAGDEPAFATLFQQYLALNEKNSPGAESQGAAEKMTIAPNQSFQRIVFVPLI